MATRATPTTALQATLFNDEDERPSSQQGIRTPSQAQTAQALPLSVTDPGGQSGSSGGQADDEPQPSGDGAIPDRPELPEAPSYPRIDTSQREQPQIDTEGRRRQALTALLGALGAGFASAGDDPTLLSIGAGLSQGATDELGRKKEDFKRRQQAFNEFLTEAQRFNREMKQRETEADYERRLTRFEQESEARQNALDRRADRQQDEQQHERTMKEIRARGEERRRTARVRNQRSGQGSDDQRSMDDLTIPDDPQQIQTRLEEVDARIQTMENQRGQFEYQEYSPTGQQVTRTDEEFLEDLGTLKQYKATLQQALQRQGGGQPQGGQPQRSRQNGGGQSAPGFGSPMNPAGPAGGQQRGGRQPSSQNQPQYGPTRRKTQKLQEYDQVARQQGPRAAIDSIEQDWRNGELSDAEARDLLNQLTSQYGQ